MTPNVGSDDDEEEKTSGKGKSRRELPAGAVATLKAWLLSPEHFTHPYPTPQDQIMLMQKTGIDKKQLKNWFTNARRRIWKPMLKKQLEQGKLAATGAGGGGVAVPGVIPGLLIPTATGAPAPGADANDSQNYQTYQQATMQPQSQSQQYDAYGNPIYQQQQQPSHPGQYFEQFGQGEQDGSTALAAPAQMASSGSIGSLPPMGSQGSFASAGQMLSKNDSHAVLMELFARDQDLVRQATESKMKAASGKGDGSQTGTSMNQIRIGSSSRLSAVPSLNSWPHFSSITSLNNLGSMTGVKSITSLSGADLASQGNLSKGGNLAQVKSIENMGKHDSYAFLEVFFGDRGSSTNLSGKDQESRGLKRDREEDSDVGLSLDADESPSVVGTMKQDGDLSTRDSAAAQPAPLPTLGKDTETGTLKRAYDDALAARGLISVSRSCEKLTDLALPAKIQRTLSQEFIRQQQQQSQAYTQYSTFASAPTTETPASQGTSQQYPGQQPTQESQSSTYVSNSNSTPQASGSDSTGVNASVEVPTATKCALCQKTDIDTQLNPCGCYFHHKCLKPSLQTPMGQPKCPIDHIPIQSALLAIPTDEQNASQRASHRSGAWSAPAASSSFQSAPALSAGSSSSKA